MRRNSRRLSSLVLAMLVSPSSGRSALADDTLAVQWNEVLLEAIRTARMGPPMVARAIGEVHTCGFDAWAAYDDVAIGTQLGGSLRRPADEHTPRTRRRPTATASFGACSTCFRRRASFSAQKMSSFGFDPDDASTDPATPQGIGNLAGERDHRIPSARRLQPAR